MPRKTKDTEGELKYDGKRRGWAKFDTRMSNECLGNEQKEISPQYPDIPNPQVRERLRTRERETASDFAK